LRVKGRQVSPEEFTVSSDNLFQRVKELLHEGNVTRIIIEDVNGKVLLEITATVGVISAVLAPLLAALGVIAALVTDCKMVVTRREMPIQSSLLSSRLDL